MAITHAAARAHFPGCCSATAFLDNAGGSQLPGVVIEAMAGYLRESYVQLGADYDASRRATAVVGAAHRFLHTFMGAVDGGGRPVGTVIMGASTSQLMATLATATAPLLAPGDEVVLSIASHESNSGCWRRLGAPVEAHGRGVVVREWMVDERTGRHGLADLERLLGPRTRVVGFPLVSNVLGEVMPGREIVELVRRKAPGARVVVDAVAYAPHRALDVLGLGADFCVYSTYKVFGPHAAALWASSAAIGPLTGPNHDFIPRDELPRKFELGGVSHEAAAGVLALDHYLRDLIGVERRADLAATGAGFDRGVVERAMGVVERLEGPLTSALIGFLKGRPGVRIIGPETADESRVGIVSFVREGRSSAEIARAGNALGLGFRFGNFYAYRLCRRLGLDPSDGVVRVSFCHYNTPAEVERLTSFLAGVL
jgi:cysteine desulfurase family protein (TIGR01976 family)